MSRGSYAWWLNYSEEEKEERVVFAREVVIVILRRHATVTESNGRVHSTPAPRVTFLRVIFGFLSSENAALTARL